MKKLYGFVRLKELFREESKLRNCIPHYKINEEHLARKEINIESPFFELIEKYTGKDFYILIKKLKKI